MHFDPPGDGASAMEVSTVATLRRRAGAAEFVMHQRLEFELLISVESGAAFHEVDFTNHRLEQGDVLWVHLGQVQRWGRLQDIEGTVLLFQPDALAPATAALLHQLGAADRNHWPAATVGESPFALALHALSRVCTAVRDPSAVDPRAGEHATRLAAAAALLLLAGSSPPGSDVPPRHPEAFRWLVAEVEARFTSQRSVAGYAARLGYSERTLNRLTRANAGMSTKELIDRRVVLEAKRLLAHEMRPVADVADQLGFTDAANFSKYFRQRVGSAPGAFRDAHRRVNSI